MTRTGHAHVRERGRTWRSTPSSTIEHPGGTTMHLSLSTRRRSAALAALALGLGTLASTGLSPASASDDPGAVVAQGLDNPRQLSFGPDGTLYVAESGTGGDQACQS